ncbi:transglycosylase family protein [Pseudonocardia spinosispora]|uniref:LysM peptidoglycan-binding domain-containing protein n=1 Tax=Pseudonocardia spinosispora TaxID=103441 RepID=UPI000428D2F9|nr:transglycosylase family protein [Pseudonocardia spinosispora]
MKSPVLLRPRLTTQLLQLTYWTLGASGGAVVVLFGSAFLGTTAAAATPITVTSVNRPKVVAAVTTGQPRQPVAAAPPGPATGVPAALPPALTGGGGGGDVWDRIAKCESSGKWNTDTGNGYHGGLQFSPSTWKAFGGLKYAPKASKATKAQQIEIAERVQAKQGWQAWPTCSRKAGMHGHDKYRPSKKDDKHDAKKHDGAKKDHDKHDSKPKQGSSKSGTITVRSGDTLAGLAKKHGVKNWRDLYEANRSAIDNPGRIFVGQKLTLPKS